MGRGFVAEEDISRPEISFEKLAYASEMLKVLGHPLRLRIVELLDTRGELSVGELVTLTGEAQPTVSQHLTTMKLRGVLVSRRQGGQMFYSIAHVQVRKVLDCVRTCEVDPHGDRAPGQ